MFSGVFVAIVTPFKNDEIDVDALRKLTARLIESGVDGLIPCGTTGEAATLEPEEYSKIVKEVVAEVRGRCPVIAGAGSNSTEHAIKLAKLVLESGADGTLQVTPYYNKPTQEGLYQHFKKIADEAGGVHILYNVPGRTSVNMLPETVERLHKVKNIVGLKEASGNLEQIEMLRGLVPPDFSIFSGNDDQNLEVYKRGGSGTISVTANVAPVDVVKVWNYFSDGNVAEAERAQIYIQELNNTMFIETNPIPVKTALSLMGLCREEFRLPMTVMRDENKNKLKLVLEKYKFLNHSLPLSFDFAQDGEPVEP